MDAENNNTPRTEANLHGEFPYLVDADFARQLERELAETERRLVETALKLIPTTVDEVEREEWRQERNALTASTKALIKERDTWIFNANELQKGYNKLDKEVIELNESLKEAHEIISHFGWTSSDSTEVILKAERWLAAQPEETK